MQIVVVGLGYVGLVTAACLAEWGHRVTGIERDPRRIDALRSGTMPFHEPGLEELVERHIASGRLDVSGSDDAAQAIRESEVAFVAVGTHDGNGGWQTETMADTLATVVPELGADSALVVRSTLPPAFIAGLPALVESLRDAAGAPPVPVIVNPEFTQEGRAVEDFLHPERIILGIGSDPDGDGTSRVERVYEPHVEAPILTMSAIDAMLSKLGANLFLATKISFANELASLCDLHGASVEEVVRGMSHDHRIGGSFLRAGVGFGGSCLPQQVAMTVVSATDSGAGVPLLTAVDQINRRQRVLLVDRLAGLVGGSLRDHRIALLGLTFKPGTDDLREAPALEVARLLLDRGARVVGYDPMPKARSDAASAVSGLETAATAMDALTGADAAGLVTEWAEFGELDWGEAAQRMASPRIVDGRNFLPADELVAAGFEYAGFGRPDAHGRSSRSTSVHSATTTVAAGDRRHEEVTHRA